MESTTNNNLIRTNIKNLPFKKRDEKGGGRSLKAMKLNSKSILNTQIKNKIKRK